MLLHNEYKPNSASLIKVYNFKTLFNSDPNKTDDPSSIKKETDFAIISPEDSNPLKIGTRSLWYVDNESFFVATTDGWVIHYDLKGNIVGKRWIHEGVKINSIAFSKNFAVLATAADNGSKIVDPETF